MTDPSLVVMPSMITGSYSPDLPIDVILRHNDIVRRIANNRHFRRFVADLSADQDMREFLTRFPVELAVLVLIPDLNLIWVSITVYFVFLYKQVRKNLRERQEFMDLIRPRKGNRENKE